MVSDDGSQKGGVLGRLRTSSAGRTSGVLMPGGGQDAAEPLNVGAFLRAVDETAAGFVDLGVQPGEHVAMIADNHRDWLITDLALIGIGAVTVPRGADASSGEIAFCVGHAACTTALFDTHALLDRVRPVLAPVARIIVMREAGRDAILGLAAIRARGAALLGAPGSDSPAARALRDRQSAVTPETLATIVYTSGTTGNPKGVMLSHGNLLHNIRVVPAVLDFKPGMRFVSFLPTWHMFERTIEYIVIDRGLELHYSSKRTLKADIARVKPHFLVGVPRVWEAFYQGVMTAIEKLPAGRRRLIDSLLRASAVHHDLVWRRRGMIQNPPGSGAMAQPGVLERLSLALAQLLTVIPEWLAQKLVYAKLRAALGGKLVIAISGGGPLPDEVDQTFLRAGIPFLNGYGLTETAPVVCVRLPKRNVPGTIGRALPDTEIRITDDQGAPVPPLSRGLITVHGPQVMSGYWNNPEATKACLTADGWFNSGDLGLLSDQGDLVINGRAKDTIVLKGGEKVEPETIENALRTSPLIADVIVVGHTRKALGALVVPNVETLRARGVSIPEGKPEDLAKLPAVDAAIRAEVQQLISPERGFRIYERIVRVGLLPNPFSVADGTLTATLKKRRAVIEQRFHDQIAALFAAT